MIKTYIFKPFTFYLSLFACLLFSTTTSADAGPVDGGVLSIAGGGTSIDICAGDNNSDAFDVTLTDSMAENSHWVITDQNGIILGLPASPPFDLEGAGAGICLIWHLSSAGPLDGLNVNADVANLTGCFDFSNEITVNREGVDGGQITFADGSFFMEICSGDGVPDPIQVSTNGSQVGSDLAWAITDNQGMILALPSAPPFDLEPAGPGTCLITAVAYNTLPAGLTIGNNINDLVGCHGLSNPISVKRNGVNGGTLTTTAGFTTLNICGNDGVSDAFNVSLTDNTGEFGDWVITDSDGTILAIPAQPPFDVEGAGPGTCQIWFVAFFDQLTGLEVGNNVSQIQGCFDFSNPITVNRDGVDSGVISLEDGGGTSVDVCSGDGIPDLVYVDIDWNPGGTSKWVITDANQNILDLPNEPPFDFEGASEGVCQIWHISHCPNFAGLDVGNNISQLTGDYEISNAITVNRTAADGGSIAIANTGATQTEICAGDGNTDAFDVTLMDNVGANGSWVITDPDGNILGLPAAPPFDLEGAGAGVCQIWYLSYDDGLMGLAQGNNVEDLEGCFDFSNAITVTRYQSEGGDLSFANGNTTMEICAGDGVSDAFTPTLINNSGEESAWIITDANNTILALPAGPPFDLEGAGGGECLIWHLSYGGNILGLLVGENANDLSGCLSLSNPLTVNRVGVDGGELATTNGATEVDICAGDDISDAFDVMLAGNVGPLSAWVITDPNGTILGLPPSPPFDLDQAGPGTCLIWHLSYDFNPDDLAVGNNVNDFDGCFDFSNSITVHREDPTGGELRFQDGSTEMEICVGDGNSDSFTPALLNNSGSESAWIITNPNGTILDLPSAPPFDFEGAGFGQCLVWHISYGGTLDGLEVGENANDLMGCFELSNSISVNRTEVAGGTLATTDGQTDLSICAGDGISDAFDVTLTDNIGTFTAWVITDGAGNILGLPAAPPFDLEGAGAGICQIWNVSYEDMLTGLAVDNNVSDLQGCFAFSNPITVNRSNATGGELSLEGGGDALDICAGDGNPDPFNVELIDNAGENSGWVITDPNGLILGLPAGPPFDLEGAGGGVCLVWHISYDDGLSGLEVDANANDLSGCFDLSNPITVTREGVAGGTLTTSNGATEVFFCVGDGNTDFIFPTLSDNAGNSDKWILTDDNGVILGVPELLTIDFDQQSEGICHVYNISYSNVTGLTIGENIADLEGCYSLSNDIVITKTEDDNEGGDLEIVGGGTEIDVCVGDGVLSPIDVNLSNTAGDNTAWLITDPQGLIIAVPPSPPFEFEAAGPGQCLIWNISYGNGLTGLEAGNLVVNLVGCFDLSNSITVNREEVAGGSLAILGGETELEICAGDGMADPFEVETSGAVGANQAWVITDAESTILGLPAAPPFDLEGAGAGVCFLWQISYADGLTGLEVDGTIPNLEGCYALSNAITVTRVTEGPTCLVGTNDLVNHNAFTVTPNPTADLININISSAFNNEATLRLMDISGKVLMDRRTRETTVPMNLGTLADGVYFLEVRHETFVGVQKIVKQ